MQYNTAGQPKSRPTRDYAPKKHKNKKLANLPLLLLFVALLALMYVLFPKEAGRHVGHSQYEGLVISEVMSANNSAVPDENGNFPDWLEIYNGTDHDIDMEGVMISHRSDRISFPFPAYTLKAGERVIVYASNSWQKDDPTKPFHGKFKISSAGAHLALYDPDMYLIDEITVPTMTPDTSYILASIDEDGTRHYEVTDYYSPGYENTEEGFLAYRSANAMAAGSLVINEVCPDPKVGIPDEDGDMSDWLELKNNTESELKLFASRSVEALKTEVTNLINGEVVTSNIKAVMADPKFMQKVILTLVESWPEKENLTIQSADADSLKQYFLSNAKSLLDKGVKIEQVNGKKTSFSVVPADGSYKITFGEDEFVEFFKEFLRPQLVEALF